MPKFLQIKLPLWVAAAAVVICVIVSASLVYFVTSSSTTDEAATVRAEADGLRAELESMTKARDRAQSRSTANRNALEELQGEIGVDAEPASTSAPTPAPTAKSDPVGISFRYDCTDSGYEHYAYESLEEVWNSGDPIERCDANASGGGDPTEEQLQAVSAAYDRDGVDGLGTLYGICADTAFKPYIKNDALSDVQTKELSAALTLCPESPKFEDLNAKIEASKVILAQRADGSRFGGGVKKVGEDIQPGTYVAEGDIESCYWERQDSAANIIDNAFIGNALRVEVWIDASDFAFTSQGCGEWVRQA